MKTPKEKAKELFDKYFNSLSEIKNARIRCLQAEECALICVDEIIRELNQLSKKNCEMDGALAISRVNFLHEVKYEIAKI